MKALKVILIILVVIFGGYCIWMATLPSEFTMERSTMINTRPQAVFAEVNDLTQWPAWSPWYKMDSTMEMEYSESPMGEGAYYSWKGDPETVGAGKYTNASVTPNEEIKYNMEFEGMGGSDGYWRFEALDDSKTKVIWGFPTEFGFFDRIGGMFIEKGLGPQFEQGLANLKETVETSSAEEMKMVEVATVQTEPMDYYGIREELAFSDLSSEKYSAVYGEIINYLGEDAQNMTGAPFAIFYTWDEENGRTEMEFAIPASSSKPGNDRIKKGKTYEGTALKASHMGAYEGTHDVHIALGDHIQNHDLTMSGAPWEVYVVDPGEEPDTNKWVTDIYYPVGSDMAANQ